jgi:putative transposase
MLCVKKIKIETNKEQQVILDSQSKITNWLYNHYLEAAARYYRLFHKTLTYNKINSKFSKFKDKHPFLKTVNNTVLKNTLRTLEKSFNNFFRRLKKGDKKAGFPKFKSWKLKWRCLEYDKDKGFKLIDNNAVQINFGKVKDEKTGKSFIPNIVVKLSEALEDKPSQITITKDKHNYYVCFRVDKAEPEPRKEGKTVALDLNQSNLFGMVDDKGNQVISDKPYVAKYFDKEIDKLKSKRDRCKKHSKMFKYLNNTISRIYRKRREQIKLCLYTLSNRIIKGAKKVVVGDYSPFKSGIKNINHGVIAQGLVGQFRETLKWVCVKNGVEFEIVNESYTSKTCSHCENVKSKNELTLKDRIYFCHKCGTIIHRDINSTLNILNKVLRRTRHSLGIAVGFLSECIANWKWMSNRLSSESLQINF